MVLFFCRDNEAIGTLFDHHATGNQRFPLCHARRRLLSCQLCDKPGDYRTQAWRCCILKGIGPGDGDTLGNIQLLHQSQDRAQLGSRRRHEHDAGIPIGRHRTHQPHRGKRFSKSFFIDVLRTDCQHGNLVIGHLRIIDGKAAHLRNGVLDDTDIAIVLDHRETPVLQNRMQQIDRLRACDGSGR